MYTLSSITAAQCPVSVADINNDGRLDLIVPNQGFNHVGVFLGYGNGSFSTQLTFATGAGTKPYTTAVADFNNDGRLDIAAANRDNRTLGILLGHGNGSFGPPTTYSTGAFSIPERMGVADFNRDGLLDIAVTNLVGDLGIFLGNGGGTFQAQYVVKSGIPGSTTTVNPSDVAVGDFNGDNKTDIAVANYGVNNIGILLGIGNGNFSTALTIPTGSSNGNPFNIIARDFNHDNKLDLAYSILTTNETGVMLGLGNGSFATPVMYTGGSNPYTVVAADFNMDSHVDLVIINGGSPDLSIFYGIGNGAFQSPITYPLGGLSSYGIAVGDFNQDVKPDLAVSVVMMARIGILLNSC